MCPLDAPPRYFRVSITSGVTGSYDNSDVHFKWGTVKLFFAVVIILFDTIIILLHLASGCQAILDGNL